MPCRTLILTHPLWLVRTRILIHGKFSYPSLYLGLSTMIKEEGIKSVYKGMGPSFLGISHVAVQFPTYEKLKIMFTDRHSGKTLTNVDLICASSLSKLIACAVTYPHEVIRTRLLTQTHRIGDRSYKYRGIIDSGRTIVFDEGIAGLYKGLGTALVRTVPATAVSIFMYEIIIRDIFKK